MSGAGKTTIANELDNLLIANRNHSYILDGDFVREGLSSDLSFTKKDREENLRRIKHVSDFFPMPELYHLLHLSHLLRMTGKNTDFFERLLHRGLCKYHRSCGKRDPKVFTSKKRLIRNFTGIDSPYEEPNNPDIVLDTERYNATDCALKVFNFIKVKHMTPTTYEAFKTNQHLFGKNSLTNQ